VAVVLGEVVDDAGDAGVQLTAAELLGRDLLPVAAFTSGGPPRKIVPWLRTMTVSSLIAGTYAPPAVHEPMTQAIWGMPSRRHLRLVVEDATEVLAVGEHLVLLGRKAPPESTR
jgi:hypothetical protein